MYDLFNATVSIPNLTATEEFYLPGYDIVQYV
jgi:hypothetical protein